MSTWGSRTRDLFSLSLKIEQEMEDEHWSHRRFHLGLCGVELTVVPWKRRGGWRPTAYSDRWYVDVYWWGGEVCLRWNDVEFFWLNRYDGDAVDPKELAERQAEFAEYFASAMDVAEQNT